MENRSERRWGGGASTVAIVVVILIVVLAAGASVYLINNVLNDTPTDDSGPGLLTTDRGPWKETTYVVNQYYVPDDTKLFSNVEVSSVTEWTISKIDSGSINISWTGSYTGKSESERWSSKSGTFTGSETYIIGTLSTGEKFPMTKDNVRFTEDVGKKIYEGASGGTLGVLSPYIYLTELYYPVSLILPHILMASDILPGYDWHDTDGLQITKDTLNTKDGKIKVDVIKYSNSYGQSYKLYITENVLWKFEYSEDYNGTTHEITAELTSIRR